MWTKCCFYSLFSPPNPQYELENAVPDASTLSAELTYVSRRATSSGHDVSGALHLRETEVADHDLRLILGIKVQQILRLDAKKRG